MLVTLAEVLKDAHAKRYAVGAYNALSLEMIRGIIAAAEAERAPVILEHAEVHFQFTPLEAIAPIMIHEARRAKVPVVVHLDHGQHVPVIRQAIELGFSSVMFDGSTLPFAENVQTTRAVVEFAKERGVSVEAELGHVPTSRVSGEGAAHGADDTIYTDPDQAVEYAAATGVDALAVAFGTIHGKYLAAPRLDFERLRLIKERTAMPLVMHGGSGLTEADYRQAIAAGVNKINYYSYLAKDVAEKLASFLSGGEHFYHELIPVTIDAVREHVAGTMRLFGTAGKA
ncbi:fructose-bisphosphate aldolase class II [Hydrogenispora ethanolica]|uniref:Fructose-bisphosphate aldolase class II n=1 Tax=Hydrogenispora ethanolica TaxID=1082276 RepID=A0A4R1QSL7_HYDET|nr:class II fructose-bisphosphate aldolase [Hydrogenispora ethanolica]TCL56033.1 fructose-bisphosphate aldolase class II [Hydrogenispora ethanolica]